MGYSKFSNSLSPLLLWLRLIGVNLIHTKSGLCAVGKKKCLIASYSIICFLVSVTVQTDVLLYLYWNLCEYKLHGEVQLKTITSSWNTVIDLSNYAMYGVGSHFMLLVFVRPRWAGLVECFNRFDNHLDDTFLIRLRRVSWIGPFFILFWVC